MSNSAPTNSANFSAQSEQAVPTQPAFFVTEDEPFNLIFHVVGNDDRIGGVRYQSHISPYFATADQARAFKADALEQYPDCYCMAHTAYYRSEDDSNRLELLAAIVPAMSADAAMLNKLQQDIDKTIGALSSQQQAAFIEALERIQTTHDYLLKRISSEDCVTDSGIEQITGILNVQLDEILAAAKLKAQNQRAQKSPEL